MNNLNTLIVEGNCVRTPVLSATIKGKVYCILSIATHRCYKINETFQNEVSFFEIEVWGKQAELAAKNCSKGRGIRVAGRLKQSCWKDTEGKNKSRVRIVATHIDFKPMFSKSSIIQSTQNRMQTDGIEIADAISEGETEPLEAMATF